MKREAQGARCLVFLILPAFAPAALASMSLTFGDPNIVSASAQQAHAVHAADLDGDGDIDLLSASWRDNSITWYESDGGAHPTFTRRPIHSDARGARAVLAADLDGDSDMDVLSASSTDGKIAWYESDGAPSPTFTPHTIATVSFAFALAVADLDGDGLLDVVSVGWNQLLWSRRTTDGFTNHVISNALVGGVDLAVGDLDGDGRPDLLTASQGDDTVAWYRNNGEALPTFTRNVLTTTADGAASVVTADFDGDGDLDIAAAARLDNAVYLFENLGGAPVAFGQRLLADMLPGAVSLHAADLNDDLAPDLLVAAEDSGQIAWLENNRDLPVSFTKHIATDNAPGVKSVSAADIDDDGRLDILAALQFNDQVVWYQGDTVPSTPTPTNSATSTPSHTSTVTPTITATHTPSATPTMTPTASHTPSPTVTPSPTHTEGAPPTSTSTATQTSTQPPTDTPTQAPTDTPPNTSTHTPTNTPMETSTHTLTTTNTPTHTTTHTHTPTDAPSDTPTNTPTDTPTDTPMDTETPEPSFTPTDTASETPSHTPIEGETETPALTATHTPTQAPPHTATETPSATPTASPTPTETLPTLLVDLHPNPAFLPGPGETVDVVVRVRQAAGLASFSLSLDWDASPARLERVADGDFLDAGLTVSPLPWPEDATGVILTAHAARGVSGQGTLARLRFRGVEQDAPTTLRLGRTQAAFVNAQGRALPHLLHDGMLIAATPTPQPTATHSPTPSSTPTATPTLPTGMLRLHPDPALLTWPATSVEVALRVQGMPPFHRYDVAFSYDAALIEVESVRSGDMLAGPLLLDPVALPDAGGTLRLAQSAAEQVSGSGVLAHVRFRARVQGDAQTDLHVTSALLTDLAGVAPPLHVRDGLLQLVGPTATSTSTPTPSATPRVTPPLSAQALDINRDGRIDAQDLLLLIELRRAGAGIPAPEADFDHPWTWQTMPLLASHWYKRLE